MYSAIWVRGGLRFEFRGARVHRCSAPLEEEGRYVLAKLFFSFLFCLFFICCSSFYSTMAQVYAGRSTDDPAARTARCRSSVFPRWFRFLDCTSLYVEQHSAIAAAVRMASNQTIFYIWKVHFLIIIKNVRSVDVLNGSPRLPIGEKVHCSNFGLSL